MRVVGVGEILIDHVFEQVRGRLVYRGSRGGGSVPNVLANLSSHGIETSFTGVGGSDHAFEIGRADLAAFGVDLRSLRQIPKRLTRQVFQHPAQPTRAVASLHRFSMLCPVCNRLLDEDKVAHAAQAGPLHVDGTIASAIVCFDRLTANRLALSSSATMHGALSVLDLGRTSFFRFIPAAKLAASFRGFNLVQCTESVASSLAGRMDLNSPVQLVADARLPTMIITKGRDGLSVIGPRRDGSVVQLNVPAPDGVNVRDDAGAGDALLAGILRQLVIHRGSSGVNTFRLLADEVAEMAQAATADLPPVLQSLGARGHLPGRWVGGVFDREEIVGLDVDDLVEEGESEDSCVVCGQGETAVRLPTRRGRAAGAQRNVSLLVDRAFHAAESDGVDVARELLARTGRAITVGTGGSFPAAIYASHLLNGSGNWFAAPMKPLDVIRLRPTADYFFLMSYSGRTPDARAVLNHVRARRVGRIVLVTRRATSELGDLLDPTNGDLQITYGIQGAAARNSRGERGFVSIAGTVSPCACLLAASIGRAQTSSLFESCAAIAQNSELRDGVAVLADRYKKIPRLALFASGWAGPAMYDLESKFCEAGILGITQHEAKDFSHGRFMSLFGHENDYAGAIFMTVGRRSAYEEQLGRALTEAVPTVVLESARLAQAGAFEVLIQAQFLAHWFAQAIDIDLSRPEDIPEKGLQLYKWSGDLE